MKKEKWRLPTLRKKCYNNVMKFRLLLPYFLTAFLVFCVVQPIEIFAASSSNILVDVTPSNPAPNEDTTITLSSYANNLDSVLIQWSVDGKNVSSGIGQKSFSLMAPASGSQAVILARISLPDGELEKRIIIRPSVMVLLSQANDSYVPPFYKGKALPTADSEIKVVAMPEIKINSTLVDAKNLTYAWKKDYTNMPGESGYGKNSFVYVNDYLEDSSNISVTVSTVNQDFSVDGNINIGMSIPKINFYKNDNTLGTIWDIALSDPYQIQGPETIVAVPYFISPKEIQNPRLVWNWSINDSIINILGFKKNVIPLQPQSGASGTSKLKLEVENMDKIFQTVSKTMSVEF